MNQNRSKLPTLACASLLLAAAVAAGMLMAAAAPLHAQQTIAAEQPVAPEQTGLQYEQPLAGGQTAPQQDEQPPTTTGEQQQYPAGTGEQQPPTTTGQYVEEQYPEGEQTAPRNGQRVETTGRQPAEVTGEQYRRPAGQQPEGAMFRVAHLSPDAPEGDVYVDGQPVAAMRIIPFGTVSPYEPIPGGSRTVEVYAAGETPETSEPALRTDLDLRAGVHYTLGVVGMVEDGSLAAKVYEDDNSPPAAGEAKVRVIHAVLDVEAATAGVAGDEKLFTLPAFSNASRYAEIRSGTRDMKMRPAGKDSKTHTVPAVELAAGEVYTVFALRREADGPLDAVVAHDSGTGAGGDVGVVVSMRRLLARTGGELPAALVLGAALLVAGAAAGLFTLRRHRAQNGDDSPPAAE